MKYLTAWGRILLAIFIAQTVAILIISIILGLLALVVLFFAGAL